MMDRLEADIDVTVIVKGDERYVFLYDVPGRLKILRAAGRYASDPEMSFTWQDAAAVCKVSR